MKKQILLCLSLSVIGSFAFNLQNGNDVIAEESKPDIQKKEIITVPVIKIPGITVSTKKCYDGTRTTDKFTNATIYNTDAYVKDRYEKNGKVYKKTREYTLDDYYIYFMLNTSLSIEFKDKKPYSEANATLNSLYSCLRNALYNQYRFIYDPDLNSLIDNMKVYFGQYEYTRNDLVSRLPSAYVNTYFKPYIGQTSGWSYNYGTTFNNGGCGTSDAYIDLFNAAYKKGYNPTKGLDFSYQADLVNEVLKNYSNSYKMETTVFKADVIGNLQIGLPSTMYISSTQGNVYKNHPVAVFGFREYENIDNPRDTIKFFEIDSGTLDNTESREWLDINYDGGYTFHKLKRNTFVFPHC